MRTFIWAMYCILYIVFISSGRHYHVPSSDDRKPWAPIWNNPKDRNVVSGLFRIWARHRRLKNDDEGGCFIKIINEQIFFPL